MKSKDFIRKGLFGAGVSASGATLASIVITNVDNCIL